MSLWVFRMQVGELRKHRMGDQLSVLATLQYYQALRASEAAALRWEDVRFNIEKPSRSRLHFSQHISWIRGSRELSFIEPGFKNSDGYGGVKEHPMLPEVFNALMLLYRPGAKGLVFKNGDGTFLRYRQICQAYDRAFEAAGLPYRGTHVMRHGGTRKTFEETRGDRDIAAQQLGNRDAKTVDVYARRSASAFSQYAEEQWEKVNEKLSGGNWQQEPKRLALVKDLQ